MTKPAVTSAKVLGASNRSAAMDVVREVFCEEKHWVQDAESQVPEDLADGDPTSWFVAFVGGRPAGVIRLLYDCPIEIPADFEVTMEREIDLEKARGCRWVEVGRFMIRPEYRARTRVAIELMRCAVTEVVTRGYTHFITDVFEGDPHSPLKFHTHVLGFERIGTHRFGELDCDSMRIVLILDLARAYRRAKESRNRIYRELAAGVSEALEALPASSLV